MSNQLVFVKENKVVTDSLMVADVFGKEHKNVLRDINVQIEKMKEAGEEKWAGTNFEHTQYQHPQNKQWYPKYDLTEEGFAIITMSYISPDAMKVKIKFIQEFKRMKEYIQNQQQPKSEIELIQMAVNQMVKESKRIDVVEQNVEKLQKDVEERLTLDYGQQQVMKNAVGRRVYKLWDEDKVDKTVYESTKKLFPALYRNLKQAYRVNSYANILQKDFDEAMSFIEGWRPMFNRDKSVEGAALL